MSPRLFNLATHDITAHNTVTINETMVTSDRIKLTFTRRSHEPTLI